MREEGDHRECVYVNWHDKLVLYKAYNIATINKDLLTKIVHELDSREVQANLELVCTLTCINHTKLTFFLTHHCV